MLELDLKAAILIAIKTINLGNKGFHKDYDRVTKLADLYKKLITGEDISSLLIQFTPREDKEQFKQRVALTQLVTPAVCEKIKSPFYKVSRIDNVNKQISYKDKDTDSTAAQKKIAEIEQLMENFWGDESFEDYLETSFVDLSFSDPNAFILVEFDPFNAVSEKAKPYPLEISSKEAINFKYINNRLQFLIVRKDITYAGTTPQGKESIKNGYKYIIYTKDFSLQFTQVEGKENNAVQLNIETIQTEAQTIKIGPNYFKIEYFNPKSGEIQAIRVGYKRDLMTDKRTYVNPFHAAVPRMMKTIKSISELDLTTTLHVYPQKLQYVQACPGDVIKNDICRSGQNRNGDKCTQCNGTGVVIHKSSADAITLPLPKTSEEMFDLDKLLIYKNPSIELIKYQGEYVEALEEKAMRDVFVAQSFDRATSAKTAKENELDMESVYDVLFPFANKFSTVYKKLLKLSAIFTDNGTGISIIHQFPKDFKLKTIKALLADLEQADNANAPSYIKTEISHDIATKMWADNPEALNRFKVKQQHIPFFGKTAEQIQVSINNGDVTRFDRVLYGNFESIIKELDAEQMAKRLDFFNLSFDKRTELIKEKVNAYIEIIDSERKAPEGFNTLE